MNDTNRSGKEERSHSSLHASTATFENDLKSLIQKKKVVVLVGAGLSRNVCDQSPSWLQLVRNGIEYAAKNGRGGAWCDRSLQALNSEPLDLDALFEAANMVAKKLGVNEFGRWLKETFANLHAHRRQAIDALVALGMPIMTTNYDDLLTGRIGRALITPVAGNKMSEWLRGDEIVDRSVFHIHGHYDEPSTVVFSELDYQKVVYQTDVQSDLLAIGKTKSLLIVGCSSEGLQDPNLGRFLDKLADYEERHQVQARHYRLVTTVEYQPPQGRIQSLVYGDTHDKLAEFLVRLNPNPRQTSGSVGNIAAGMASADLTKTISISPTATVELLDQVLLAYSETRLAEWNKARSDLADRHQLFYYVPPHYSLIDDHNEPQRIEGDTEEEILAKLLQTSDRLCVSEGPGAGKSVFTRRVEAFLSSDAGRKMMLDGRPALAVRWEQWGGSWPDDFPAELSKALIDGKCGCKDDTLTRDLVSLALEAGRVTLIMDALDQVNETERITRFSDFLNRAKKCDWPVRVIMTGRPFAVDQRRNTLLTDNRWKFLCIEDFDAYQQYRYLRGAEETFSEKGAKKETKSTNATTMTKMRSLVDPIDLSAADARDSEKLLNACQQSLRRRFENYDQVDELLGNPAVLDMVRKLLERNALTEFRRRGDLYEQTSRDMLTRAANLLGWESNDVRIDRAQEVLAAIACQMMVENPELYRIDGDGPVQRVRKAAAQRLPGGIQPEDWDLVMKLTGLTNQSLLYGASQRVLGWHHKGMMEFYCGLHLARNKQEKWSVEEEDRDGHRWPMCSDRSIQLAASNPQWHWAFRFAIELSPDARVPLVAGDQNEPLLATIATLFKPVESKDRARPTELMCRAWSLLEKLPRHQWCDAVEPKLLRDGHRIIERFRREFAELCSDGNSNATTRELATRLRFDEQRDRPDPDPNNREPNKTNSGEYRRIPDRGNHATFKGERPVRVRVTPFWLRKFVVTNEEYRLFDPAHVSTSDYSNADFNHDEQPAVQVDWYMSTMYCRWLGSGYRLPTEAEWEAACRAGTEDRYWFGNEESELEAHAWFGESWRESSTHTLSESRKVKGHENPWGLYDMHGNVWEWCLDWYGEYDATQTSDPVGPSEGSSRVIRGGGWDIVAADCRSAFRGRVVPTGRRIHLGFRLALSPSGASGPAERGSR